ncbi:putative membrane protein (plasmid) [Fibrella aestuarina BUZ 2]|uniref:Putative membrane protein n=1 Tax=Fibrella aestuarina BUZ 2 TaxID=1166018 RepID=I0KHN3_9BACT|nr:EamA family transporter [Fibrella aestuarina]CCH03636.1 putative membrane protein [Fibrella aestuarina BUZ 2]
MKAIPTWVIYSLISMLFAGLTSVVAKLGLKAISADLGLAVRTTVVFGLVLLNFLLFQNIREVGQLNARTVGFLAVSGLTTSLSWIFYYKAIQIGRVSDVALIDKGSIILTILLSIVVLREPVTPKLLLGGGLILAGLLVLVWR